MDGDIDGGAEMAAAGSVIEVRAMAADLGLGVGGHTARAIAAGEGIDGDGAIDVDDSGGREVGGGVYVEVGAGKGALTAVGKLIGRGCDVDIAVDGHVAPVARHGTQFDLGVGGRRPRTVGPGQRMHADTAVHIDVDAGALTGVAGHDSEIGTGECAPGAGAAAVLLRGRIDVHIAEDVDVAAGLNVGFRIRRGIAADRILRVGLNIDIARDRDSAALRDDVGMGDRVRLELPDVRGNGLHRNGAHAYRILSVNQQAGAGQSTRMGPELKYILGVGFRGGQYLRRTVDFDTADAENGAA